MLYMIYACLWMCVCVNVRKCVFWWSEFYAIWDNLCVTWQFWCSVQLTRGKMDITISHLSCNYEWFLSTVGTYDTTWLSNYKPIDYWLWMQSSQTPQPQSVDFRCLTHFDYHPVFREWRWTKPTNKTEKNLAKKTKICYNFLSLHFSYGSFRVFLPPNTVTLLPPLPLPVPAGLPVTLNTLLLRFPVWTGPNPVPAKSSPHPNSHLVGNWISSPRHHHLRRPYRLPNRNRLPICAIYIRRRRLPDQRRTKGRTGGPNWVPRWAKRELCGTRSTGTGSGEQVHVQSKKGIYEQTHTQWLGSPVVSLVHHPPGALWDRNLLWLVKTSGAPGMQCFEQIIYGE